MALTEFAVKTGITLAAGAGAGYLGREAAIFFGADETVADIIGIVSGVAGGAAAGYGMSKWQWGGKVPTQRPSWRQSELDIEAQHPKFTRQQSFLRGKEMPNSVRGSSRPDLSRKSGFLRKGKIIEVKNYNLSTQQGQKGLVNSASNQINKAFL